MSGLAKSVKSRCERWFLLYRLQRETMKNYYRVMLGRKSILAAAAHAGGYICPDVEIPQDLSPDLGDVWRAFNKKFVPIFMASHSDKTKIGAGLACGARCAVDCKGLAGQKFSADRSGAGLRHLCRGRMPVCCRVRDGFGCRRMCWHS